MLGHLAKLLEGSQLFAEASGKLAKVRSPSIQKAEGHGQTMRAKAPVQVSACDETWYKPSSASLRHLAEVAKGARKCGRRGKRNGEGHEKRAVKCRRKVIKNAKMACYTR